MGGRSKIAIVWTKNSNLRNDRFPTVFQYWAIGVYTLFERETVTEWVKGRYGVKLLKINYRLILICGDGLSLLHIWQYRLNLSIHPSHWNMCHEHIVRCLLCKREAKMFALFSESAQRHQTFQHGRAEKKLQTYESFDWDSICMSHQPWVCVCVCLDCR